MKSEKLKSKLKRGLFAPLFLLHNGGETSRIVKL